MNLFAILCRFIQGSLHTAVSYFAGDCSGLKEFQNANCLYPDLQPLFTENALLRLKDEIHVNTFYEIQDILDMHLVLFRFQEGIILTGPFVIRNWNRATAENILVSQNIPASCYLSYKKYYHSFPILDPEVLRDVLSVSISAVTPAASPYSYHPLHGDPGKAAPVSLHQDKEYDAQQVLKSYELENHFQDMIRDGQPDAAITACLMLGETPCHQYAVNDASMQSAAAIIRTLARKAAEEGGASVLIIDAITQKYAQKVSRAHGLEEYRRLQFDLIYELSMAVKKQRQQGYSYPVVTALEYIHLNYSQSLTVEDIAEACSISASHLYRVFKSETGCTVFQYVTDTRCQKAAGLLASTQLPVQEIASYVGYIDNNYFVKVFKKQIGKTPSAYRRERISSL